MKQYVIKHADAVEEMIVDAESAGKAKYINFGNWQYSFSGTFREYLAKLIYCRIHKKS